MYYTPPVERLIAELAKLPGIGPKSAQRLALHLIKVPAREAEALAGAIVEARHRVRYCRSCYNLCEDELCRFCSDERRDRTTICVVEEAKDIVPLERTGEYHGLYHVLGGAISPIDGVGPEQLRIRELLERVGKEGDHPGHQPHGGRRGHHALYRRRGEGPGGPRQPPGQRPAGGGRPRVRGRDHPGARPQGALRGLIRAPRRPVV